MGANIYLYKQNFELHFIFGVVSTSEQGVFFSALLLNYATLKHFFYPEHLFIRFCKVTHIALLKSPFNITETHLKRETQITSSYKKIMQVLDLKNVLKKVLT